MKKEKSPVLEIQIYYVYERHKSSKKREKKYISEIFICIYEGRGSKKEKKNNLYRKYLHVYETQKQIKKEKKKKL